MQRKDFKQTCIGGLTTEMILLELGVNHQQVLIYTLVLLQKGSADKTSQASTCLFIHHPLLPPSRLPPHCLLWMSLDRCYLERHVIHYLPYQLSLDDPSLIPKGSSSGFSYCPKRHLYLGEHLCCTISWHSGSQVLVELGVSTAHAVISTVFHSWFCIFHFEQIHCLFHFQHWYWSVTLSSCYMKFSFLFTCLFQCQRC